MKGFSRTPRHQFASASLIALVLAVSLAQQHAHAQGLSGALGAAAGLGSALSGGLSGLGGVGAGLGGVGGMINGLTGGASNMAGSLLGGNPLSSRGALGIGTASGSPLGLPIAGQKFNEISDHPLSDGISLGAGMVDGLVSGAAAATGLAGVSRNLAHSAVLDAAAGGALAARRGLVGSALANGLENAALAEGAAAAGAAAATGARLGAIDAITGAGARMAGALAAGAAAAESGAAVRAAEVGAAVSGALPAVAAAAPLAVANQALSRQALATDALANAQAESAIAGADMVAHGANNARSAALASNAYRQAKLANARDRVNIAGTIQNSARISDAAIATHDSATKAEDSLLGSELAVDSAATVLDSDAAYIPPVTNSLLRSLPYGRLGLRNIVPKPLTYPSVLLPDVWLNGRPVNYLNVPFRMLPYGLGPAALTNPLQMSGHSLAAGLAFNGQPFYSNNGILINGMVVDPSLAYLAGNINGVIGSSVLPILANGQLEAHDELAASHAITLQQQAGAGTSATYHGYGRLNPVPMLTGSVSDVNLSPTTTIGTTYPIGSALVVEPRDSYFQDYVDNASSRQNFDERQQ